MLSFSAVMPLASSVFVSVSPLVLYRSSVVLCDSCCHVCLYFMFLLVSCYNFYIVVLFFFCLMANLTSD